MYYQNIRTLPVIMGGYGPRGSCGIKKKGELSDIHRRLSAVCGGESTFTQHRDQLGKDP